MPIDSIPLCDSEALAGPPFSSEQQHVRDGLELASLRATVVSLLEEIRRAAAAPEAGPTISARSDETVLQSDHHGQLRSKRERPPGAALPQAEFLSMLAHELRNPLQAMAVANQLLDGAAQTYPAVAQAHGVLERQIGHLARLLDDLLDASRAANGKIILQRRALTLRDVVHAAVETSQAAVGRRQQHLTVCLPDDEVCLVGDPVRLSQVFSNLLVNASQFTRPGGSITIAAARQGTSVEVHVTDDGAGIPLELQPYVFDMFIQGQQTLDRTQGGLGIGLALVQSIVQLHGGSWAVSSPGSGFGSTFSITLPLSELAPPPQLPPAAGAGPIVSRKILLIEDNVDANEMMSILLEMEGHQVTSSFSGTDGLRLAQAGHFDIVLCDLGLPGLTGLEVIASLKAQMGQDAAFSIATTGYSDSAQRDLARAAGFDHYLVKPVDLALLLEVIDRVGV